MKCKTCKTPVLRADAETCGACEGACCAGCLELDSSSGHMLCGPCVKGWADYAPKSEVCQQEAEKAGIPVVHLRVKTEPEDFRGVPVVLAGNKPEDKANAGIDPVLTGVPSMKSIAYTPKDWAEYAKSLWSPLHEALAQAYVRGWYDGRDGKPSDDGKIEVARELVLKLSGGPR